ncbi:hypothetical protein [uncultured Psychroserpens sp.]|uniref:hypothetical protein n=1 Tax=uncultured Psychroserpens sp. TaxID=255436 RepID=UPI00261AC61E|nr:hypothetical protein [uncultured Psychroserpens sp.]
MKIQDILSNNLDPFEALTNDELEAFLTMILSKQDHILVQWFSSDKGITASDKAIDYLLEFPTYSFEKRTELFEYMFNNEFYKDQESIIIKGILLFCRSNKRALSNHYIYSKLTSAKTSTQLKMQLAYIYYRLNNRKLKELNYLSDIHKKVVLPLFISKHSKSNLSDIETFVDKMVIPEDQVIDELSNYYKTSFFDLFESLNEQKDASITIKLIERFQNSKAFSIINEILDYDEFKDLRERIDEFENFIVETKKIEEFKKEAANVMSLPATKHIAFYN